MFKLVNAGLVGTVLIAAFFLYSLEHTTRGLERDLAKAQRAIGDEREKIKLLNAEWAALTRPERLQQIGSEQLHLETLKAKQFVTLDELAAKLPPPPVDKMQAETQNQDQLGKMMEKLQ